MTADPKRCAICGADKIPLVRHPQISRCPHCDLPCTTSNCGPCRAGKAYTGTGPGKP